MNIVNRVKSKFVSRMTVSSCWHPLRFTTEENLYTMKLLPAADNFVITLNIETFYLRLKNKTYPKGVRFFANTISIGIYMYGMLAPPTTF